METERVSGWDSDWIACWKKEKPWQEFPFLKTYKPNMGATQLPPQQI
jgi:hypothetical protein